MKQLEILYSCNVTLQPSQYDSQVENISNALEATMNMLEEYEIKGTFFVDVILFSQIKKRHPYIYDKIVYTMKTLNSKKHNLEFLINPIWEISKDLHHLDHEYLLDVFAQGKQTLQEFFHDDREETTAVRIMSGKMQPFAYLQDVYQMCGIKIDASIFPKMKSTMYFDFRNIKHGEVVRFLHDPNTPDRFGKYLGLPRSTFESSLGMRMSIKNEFKKILKRRPEEFKRFLSRTHDMPKLVDLPVLNRKNTRILSPDVMSPYMFKKTMEKQMHVIKHLCVLESNLDDVSNLTTTNLSYLKNEKHYIFISLNELEKKYATSYKSLLQTK